MNFGWGFSLMKGAEEELNFRIAHCDLSSEFSLGYIEFVVLGHAGLR